MNNKTLFVIDIDRCWGCSTCVTACAIQNETSPQHSGISLMSQERNDSGKLGKVFLPVLCLQCEEAECINACPTDALIRNNDGTISVLTDKCIGCGLCEKHCIYGAISIDKTKKIAVKCDMCLDRREKDGNPMCVHHCIGGCLSTMTESKYESLAKTTHLLRKENVVYTSERFSFEKGLNNI